MRQVGRAEYKNGYADVYDTRGVLLTRQSCDRLVGYGPEGLCRDARQLLLGAPRQWHQRHAADDTI
jgi:hypothetical protein